MKKRLTTPRFFLLFLILLAIWLCGPAQAYQNWQQSIPQSILSLEKGSPRSADNSLSHTVAGPIPPLAVGNTDFTGSSGSEIIDNIVNINNAVDLIKSYAESSDASNLSLSLLISANVKDGTAGNMSAYKELISSSVSSDVNQPAKIQDLIEGVNTQVEIIKGYAQGGDASGLTIEQLEAIGITDINSYKLQDYIDAIEASEAEAADTVADIQSVIDHVNTATGDTGTGCAVATLLNAPEGQINTKSHEVTVRGIGIKAYSFKIDSGSWSSVKPVDETIKFTADLPGQHTLYVVGRDGAGKWQKEENASESSWLLDLTPPEAELLTPPSGTSGASSATVWVGGDDVKYYRYRNCSTGCEWSPIFPVSTPINLLDLADGIQNLAVIGGDTAGNWQDEVSQTVTTWNIDATLPVAVVVNGPGLLINEDRATLTIGAQSDDMEISEYKYSLDKGLTWTRQSSDQPIVMTSMGDGQYSVYINGYNGTTAKWQDDLDGENTAGATLHSWKVKTTPPQPVVLGAYPGVPASSSIALKWDATEDGLKRYFIYYAETPEALQAFDEENSLPNAIVPGPAGSTETFDIEGLSPGKTYYFGVISEDAAGNFSAKSNIADLETLNLRPEISDLYLAGGHREGDNSQSRELTIEGKNFIATAGDNLVWFIGETGGFQVAAKSGNSHTVVADVPIGAPTGEYALKVVNQNGTSPLSGQTYSITISQDPLPEVVYISPVSGESETETTITIKGSNLGAPLYAELISLDGSVSVNLTGVTGEDENTMKATVPAGSPVSSYVIRVSNANGVSSTGLVGFEIFRPVDLKDSLAPVKTTNGVILKPDASAPVDITLSTDDRDEVYGTAIDNAKIEVSIGAGTEFETLDDTDSWNDYAGLVNPPRSVPIPPEVSGRLEKNAVAFSMGTENKLRLKNGRTMVVNVSLAMETSKGIPKVYYIPADGNPELAGVTGVQDGISYEPGGVLLGTPRENVPQEGYTTYTFGLLLNHMSVYAAGFPPGGSTGTTGGGGCFIGTLSKDSKLYPILMGAMCILSIFIMKAGRRNRNH